VKAIIIEISSYLMVAISLGYLFGWLITRAMITTKFEQQVRAFKERYQYAAEGIDEIQQELVQSKSINSDLHSQNNKILLVNSSKKLQLHEMGAKFKALTKINTTQNNTIEHLSIQLSDKENELIRLKKEHEHKIKSLLYEQRGFNQKYQESQTSREFSPSQKEPDNSWLDRIIRHPKNEKEQEY
jgi:hypothetical protein